MKLFLSGNEAIAFGLLKAGVRYISGYPGTPSSEIIPAAIELKRKYAINGYFEWSVNEKSAMEEVTAASYANIKSAITFKQVGLNVAMDPFMNTALVGSPGGLVVVSADDPGPHSSQTEQDSRFLAFFAKIPVYEPSSPKEAYEFSTLAVDLSKSFEIPVMIKTATRISHSREDVEIGSFELSEEIEPHFNKNTDRFAATPHFRYLLHKALNEKIEKIKNNNKPREFYGGNILILSSGVSFSYLCDIVEKYRLQDKIKLFKFDMPYPIDSDSLQDEIDKYDKVFVVEESYPVIEMQIKNRQNVKGRLDKSIPNEGELTLDVIEQILSQHKIINKRVDKKNTKAPFKRPSLCPGCGHRSAFFAIKKVFGESAIYTGDIGCYTLGLNLKAVDTVHCMGASISFAFGFDKAFSLASKKKPIVATIGDSTFFHSGITPLINAVHNNASFLLVVLDNSTVAMTGNQKTPQDDTDSYNNTANAVSIVNIIKAIGVDFCKIEDAYNIDNSLDILKKAKEFILKNKKPAVVILKHPCVYTKEGLEENIKFKKVSVDNEKCTGCKVCINTFECPSLIFRNGVVKIDEATCIKCGQCILSCPFGAIGAEL
jgi:indolepyruvate ferredoxin oxidoreductase alpha subunit